jgi:branched-chain amino acid transport system permease protein
VNQFFQTFLDGVTIGSLYALVALGYTMVYGVLTFINFAHGDVVMVGAWASLMIASRLGWSSPEDAPFLIGGAVVLLAAMVICGALGYAIERLAYRPIRSAPRLNVLITAIGISLLLENAGQLRFIFGTEPRAMPMLLPDRVLFTLGDVPFRLLDSMILLTTVALMFALDRLVFRSKLGLAMRAVAYDQRVAALMGVPVDGVVSFTFVIGSALAAAGGFLFASKYGSLQQPADMSWILLGLKAFVAAVVGGIGNIRGAMLGGLLIGLLEMFGASYLSPAFRDVYVFALLIAVLLAKPSGLLGSATREKV